MRNHHYVVEAGPNPVLALPKGLAHQPFEPVAHDRASARFAHGTTEPRIIAIVFGQADNEQAVASAHLTSNDSPELPVADKPLPLGKRIPFHGSFAPTQDPTPCPTC